MSRAPRRIAGFTLVEALLAVALMGAILAAIATVTAQWLPNWNRGFARVQSTETLAAGLERIVADLAAAEFVTAGAGIRQPVFDGTELSVTFLRTAIGPNTRPGLELVRIVEIGGDKGLTTVRTRARFLPIGRDGVEGAGRARRSRRAGARALSRDVLLCGAGPGVAQRLARRGRSSRRRSACNCATPRPTARSRSRPQRWFTPRCRRTACSPR